MITIMRETEGKLLAVEATEKLTRQDYETVFIPQLEQLIEKYGKIRVLFYLADGFDGWELGAAWDDAVFGMTHRHDFEKIAVVGDRKGIEWAAKIGAYFVDGEVASYSSADLQKAAAWLRQ